MSEPQTEIVRVLAAVIRRDLRYLVCKRPTHKRHGGLWEFPGGKLEPGESLAQAAHRELKEELNVEVISVGSTLHIERDVGSPFQIEFVEVEIAGEPTASEHESVAWLILDQLQSLELAPCDRAFVVMARVAKGDGTNPNT
jgi:mutator protein MutT